MDLYNSVIIGTGSYLPANTVTNNMLAETVDTSHEWIFSRVGIEQRHFASKEQLTSDLATQAAKQALENANLQPNDIDLIIVGTASGDYIFPSCATRTQEKIGNTKGLAFDVAGACAGFLLALYNADNFLRLQQAKRALVIGAEIISRFLDMQDRSTSVLFGDGAGAVILEAQSSAKNTKNSRGIIGIDMFSDGSFVDILKAVNETHDTRQAKIIMNGQEVFKNAIAKLSHSALDLMTKHNFNIDEIDWFIPHQANIRIIEGIAKKLKLPEQKIIATVNKHANTSAASIPLALDYAVKQKKIKQGDVILHGAIGGGLIWGSGLIRF